MCGIVGALDLEGRREYPREKLEAMARAVAHRGPDDEHLHLEPGVALASRRLAIVDVPGGRQPMSTPGGEVWVAANGELFDYPELRVELLGRGHPLATRCDTEAWLYLYEERGTGMFERARGQFAVSLWDRRRRTLLLGRDRFGICPLYYTRQDGWLLWASEIKGLLASGLVDARPDLRGIDHLFSFFAAGTHRTSFEGIASIPPGHFLRVEGGEVRLEQYWDLDFPDAGDERRSEDPGPLIDELEARLERAVARRLRGDVPVAAYISGGLDSTTLLGMATRVAGRSIPSFTIGLDRAGPDERSKSRETAALLDSPLTTLTLDRADITAAFPRLIEAAEGPVMDTANACLLRLAGRVHDHGFKVVLTGEGADEALAGYFWYKSERVLEALGGWTGGLLPALLRRGIFGLVGGSSARPPFAAMRGLRTAQQDMYDPLMQARALIYSDRMRDGLRGHSPFDDLDLTNPRMARWHPLHRSQYVEYKLMLPGHLLLGKGDRVAMHSAVEPRFPYLDEDLVTFCSSLAPEYKLRGLREKWLLRQVAARMLPRPIASRPKSMFKADPVFLGSRVPAWVDQLLSPASLEATGYFDPKAIARERRLQRMLPALSPRRFVVDGTFTGVVATQLWHHTFLGGGLCDLPAWGPPSPHESAGGGSR